jgi:hypothetical protein
MSTGLDEKEEEGNFEKRISEALCEDASARVGKSILDGLTARNPTQQEMLKKAFQAIEKRRQAEQELADLFNSKHLLGRG